MAQKKDNKGTGVKSVGISQVRVADSWCFYIHFNNGSPDIMEWYATQEKAQERLDKYNMEGK